MTSEDKENSRKRTTFTFELLGDDADRLRQLVDKSDGQSLSSYVRHVLEHAIRNKTVVKEERRVYLDQDDKPTEIGRRSHPRQKGG